MKKTKNKGFTLVELLAVIVVLAIIMIIAIPNIMRSMDNARKGTFKVYAQRVMTKAEEQYQTDLMMGNTNTCYTFEMLGLTNTGNYRGKVNVAIAAQTLEPTFTLTLSDNNYSVSGANYAAIEKIGAATGGTALGAPLATNITCP